MNKPARYSDDVPEEKRHYWYFTTHGIGPGTIPKDLTLLVSIEGKNDKGTMGDYICLNGICNTDELKEFDLRELSPFDEYGDIGEEAKIEKFLSADGIYVEEVYEDDGDICISLEGDWKHSHLRMVWLMGTLGYTQVAEDEEDSDSDWYYSTHYFRKE